MVFFLLISCSRQEISSLATEEVILAGKHNAVEACRFVSQFLFANGISLEKRECAFDIPIYGTVKVEPRAITQARDVVVGMLTGLNEQNKGLIEDVVLVVYSTKNDEALKDILGSRAKGGYAQYDNDKNWLVTWDKDLLCNSQISVHEFGHAIFWEILQPIERARLEIIFNQQFSKGSLWQIAKTTRESDGLDWNASEYWAEGITAYFGVYWVEDGANGWQFNRNNLKASDTSLYEAIYNLYGDYEWKPAYLGGC